MPSFYHLLTVVSLISGYIEKELGGEVGFDDNEKEKGIILRWKRYDPKTKKFLRFRHKISYEEIESITEPFAFSEKIIKEYREKEEKK